MWPQPYLTLQGPPEAVRAESELEGVLGGTSLWSAARRNKVWPRKKCDAHGKIGLWGERGHQFQWGADRYLTWNAAPRTEVAESETERNTNYRTYIFFAQKMRESRFLKLDCFLALLAKKYEKMKKAVITLYSVSRKKWITGSDFLAFSHPFK